VVKQIPRYRENLSRGKTNPFFCIFAFTNKLNFKTINPISMKHLFALSTILILLNSCNKEGCIDPHASNFNSEAKKDNGSCTYYEPNLVFVFDFDSTQARLNNLGQPTAILAGNAGQSPKMNRMGAHYIELAQSAFTALGAGAILYKADETILGGENAIEFSKSTSKGKGETFFSVPLKNLGAGEYEYLRLSLAYQNYDVTFHYDSIHSVAGGGNVQVIEDFPATVASFVGYNTFITNYNIKNQNIVVNANKKQGYWGFETSGTITALNNFPFSFFDTGESAAGATTVVNPISSTSPIPAGSCVVTASFNGGKLKITGNETKDIIIRVSLSTNKSFEWVDGNANGKWEPNKGEKIVDMGLRGMIPFVSY
jgi:hypothetical protein